MKFSRHFNFLRLIPSVILCLLWVAAPSYPAFAVTTVTSTIAVSATVLSVCGITATSLAFGNYSATTTSPTTATATVTALCSSGVAFTIAMDPGIGTGATVAARKMTSGSNTLGYTIYQDSGHTIIWGDGTHSTSTLTGTATLTPAVYTAYGSIPAEQQSPAGSYVDTVTVSLSY